MSSASFATTTTTASCVECRKVFSSFDSSSSPIVYNRGCPCPVHSLCWESRLSVCIAAGVVQVRCSNCWTVLWTQNCARKRAREEEEGCC